LDLRKNVSLAPYTTFRIGGPARYFAEVRTPAELIEAVKYCRANKIKYRLLAGGSNTLISDAGFAGAVIRISGSKCEFKGARAVCDAGVSLSKVVARAVDSGLGGLEMLSGVPGTLGGAVVGNAEAYGRPISEAVESVEIFDGKNARTIPFSACSFSYRDSVFKHKKWIVLRVHLKFSPADKTQLKKTSLSILGSRKKKYPKSLRCAGCYFKNVAASGLSQNTLKFVGASNVIRGNISAGYLLEQVGAKGMRIGGISVSDIHSNIFVSDGKGKCGEVRKLASLLKARVKKKFGIVLEEEVRYIG
jgi:UDP-N-acetylmuramate dehydrogenase